jgi:hypothetical protein
VILESRGTGNQTQLCTTNCHLLSQRLECLRLPVGSAWSGNTFWLTRQSLASSDFRLVFKKHSDANQGKHRIVFKKPFIRCSQGKSLAIVTKMIDFRRWHPAQTYTMFASEKVSERNENCRFQPAYVRKAIAEKSCQVGEIRRA